MFELEDIKTVKGFIKHFGEPKEAMLMDLTQEFMEAYHRYGVDPIELVKGFGVDWIELLMKYNEDIEEYELCAIFRDLVNDYEQIK